jgi:sterol desaturase/sphingolipid hydroxylase (fatty acid hydroxylase superfamily)
MAEPTILKSNRDLMRASSNVSDMQVSHAQRMGSIATTDLLPFAVALILIAVFLLVSERFAGLRRSSRPLLPRLLINAGVSTVAFAAGLWVVRPTALALLQWTSDTRFGVLHLMPLPPIVQFPVAFLLMDLTFYWWHVANHRLPLLWRFHNVHHIDPDLDVSTALRFHFGEVVFSAGFRAIQVAAIGLSIGMFALYEVIFQANTLFHHSNVRIPIRIEQLLNLVIVTPRMHGIHHSQVREETNSNYSVVFSWWDRLHGTLGLNVPQSQIVIGVPGYSDPADNRFWNDLALPFRRQREYWRRPDGTLVRRDAATSPTNRSRLAE